MTEVIAKEPIVLLCIDEHSHAARLMGFLPGCPENEIHDVIDKRINSGYVVYGVRFSMLAKVEKSSKPPLGPTLKEGDFVKVKKPYGIADNVGLEGEVVQFIAKFMGRRLVGIKFAKYLPSMHSLGISIPPGHGWYFPYNDGKNFLWDEYLEKLP